MDQGIDQFIIKGITHEGRRFRPADWAQRLTTAVATLGPDRRIRFHPKVRMAARDGVDCVVVDASLGEDDPRLLEFLLNFAGNNELQVEALRQPADVAD
jgi:hypothetical protein